MKLPQRRKKIWQMHTPFPIAQLGAVLTDLENAGYRVFQIFTGYGIKVAPSVHTPGQPSQLEGVAVLFYHYEGETPKPLKLATTPPHVN